MNWRMGHRVGFGHRFKNGSDPNEGKAGWISN